MKQVSTSRRLHFSRVRDLIEKTDADGERVPFSIQYLCKNGGVVDTLDDACCICIGVDTTHRRHTLKFVRSGEIRRVRDILITRINDTQIIVS